MKSYLIKHPDGVKEWLNVDGFYHKESDPALELPSGKWWYINGLLHREDGPAVEYADGRKIWYLNGKRINCSTQKEFERLLKLKTFW